MTQKYRWFAMEMRHYSIGCLRALALLLGLTALGSANATEQSIRGTTAIAVADAEAPDAKPKELSMWMTIGERRFAITLADNVAARAFTAQLPLVLDMHELNGNEKKASLPKPLPTNASRPGTIQNGDLMLYGADTLVVFYLTFDSPYSYTRLGWVREATGLAKALGQQNVRVAFSRQ